MSIVFIVIVSLFGQARFLPEGVVISPESVPAGPSNISQAEFNAIVKRAQDIYGPIVSAHGSKLDIRGQWNNDKLNARASQQFGSWVVEITGGLARHPELSGDGFTLILCHEIGHHLAGFPFTKGSPFGGAWASNEGQADYFATHACAGKLWAEESVVNAGFRDKVSDFVRNECDQTWSSQPVRDLCYRTAVAMKSTIDTMATLMQKPKAEFETPDTNMVSETSDKHPDVQCRLDTSFQGILCNAPFNDRFIPGKGASRGRHSDEAEREASSFSCTDYSGYQRGLRPSCWFKAKL